METREEKIKKLAEAINKIDNKAVYELNVESTLKTDMPLFATCYFNLYPRRYVTGQRIKLWMGDELLLKKALTEYLVHDFDYKITDEKIVFSVHYTRILFGKDKVETKEKITLTKTNLDWKDIL